jgi:NAD(P)-dependent dehydrogenase (short-subunit alcohol dehydrogenase family)
LAALQEAFPDHATTFKDRLYLAAIDVTKQDDVDRIGKAITDAGRGLYAVVNSAGVAHAPGIDSLIIKSAAELDVDKEVFPVLNINVLGTLRVNKAVYPLLFESKGVIVNISSIAGRLALVGLSPYTMSKHAVSAYSASLRREHSPVRVVCVEPGFASTPMVDKQRAYLDASKADYSKTLLKKRGDEGSWEAMKKMTLQKPSDVASEVLQGLFLNPAPAPHILVDKPINKYAYLIISSLPYRLQDILLPNLG